jgi:hypothetical protein
MPWDCWTNIEEKLESAGRHLTQANREINPEWGPQYVAIQCTGAKVSDPRWRAKLSSDISAFVTDCRSIPDIIESCFGVDSNKWVKTLAPDEQRRRRKFQKSFKYESFKRLRLSRARVDTVHRQSFVEIWVKVGQGYSPLQELADAEIKPFLFGPDPASQWADSLPPRPARYLLKDFLFKTVGGRYKPLFPECESYLRRTREMVTKARKLGERVHIGHKLTKPPRANLTRRRGLF